MNKKKLLQKGVAFSILLPFSCSVALPAIEAIVTEKPVTVLASTYETDIDSIEICLADTSFCSLQAVSTFSTPELQSTTSTVDMVFSKVNLNVRSSASTSSSILGTLKSGESAVHVSTSGNWHKIIYNGGYAYVSASTSYSYVMTLSSSSGVVESLVNLNVRSSPSTSGTKVGMLYAGETAVYVETNGSWHTILFDGKVAYVSSSITYSKVVASETSGENVTPAPEENETPEENITPESESPSFVVMVTTSALNVRSSASTSSTVLGVVGYGETYEYYETTSNWHKINYNGNTAYVSASYSTVKEGNSDLSSESENCDTLIMSCVDSLNVRSSPSTSSTSVGSLDKGDMVSFTCLENGWYETVYKGQTAYVSASDVYTSLEYFEMGSDQVEEVIELGCTLLGTPYVYGATRYLNYDKSLNSYFTGNSFDCSSMVQYIYSSALGIELGSTSREQSLDGVEVAVSDLQRGDLLFFTNSDRYYNTGIERIGHVAIYLGNNYILHTASDHAVIEEISATRWSYFITARDVIND
ncbi:MAG: SH3 domain-containing protein [Bacillota bacterium]